MSFRLGLTGSIGMGKSTTAAMFAQAGCAVWDADAAVHRLYSSVGAAVAPIAKVFPDAVQDGRVSRETLRKIISLDDKALPKLEKIVHPLVQEDRATFAGASSSAIVVFDMPLLFETGADATMDATAVVWVDAETQKSRVLARGSMTLADLERILARQMPSDDKKARADYVIQTDTLDHARAQVRGIVDEIERKTA